MEMQSRPLSLGRQRWPWRPRGPPDQFICQVIRSKGSAVVGGGLLCVWLSPGGECGLGWWPLSGVGPVSHQVWETHSGFSDGTCMKRRQRLCWLLLETSVL